VRQKRPSEAPRSMLGAQEGMCLRPALATTGAIPAPIARTSTATFETNFGGCRSVSKDVSSSLCSF